MMCRIGLAQALMNDPELVLLDEPTDGVDPVGRREILDAMGHLRNQGKTVFINSHALSELESICDRVAILLKGRVAMQGRVDELTIAKQRYEIEMAGDDPATSRQRVLTAVAADWKSLHTPPAPVSVDRGTLIGGEWVELIGPLLRIGVIDPAAIAADHRRSALSAIGDSKSSGHPGNAGRSVPGHRDNSGSGPRACAESRNCRLGKRSAAMRQTAALFLDAYRDLNSRRLFWVTLVISSRSLLVLAVVGVQPDGISVFGWRWERDDGRVLLSGGHSLAICFHLAELGSG